MSIASIFGDIGAAIFGRTDIMVEGVEGVDLWICEEHNQKIKTSSYPIEDGSTISDNATVMPKEITLTGWTSNIKSLTGSLPLIGGMLGSKSDAKIKSAWSDLEKAVVAKETHTVICRLGTYENMIIVGLTAKQDKETGTNLLFEMKMRECMVVSTATGVIDKINTKDGPASNKTDKVDRGLQPTSHVEESIASKIARRIM